MSSTSDTAATTDRCHVLDSPRAFAMFFGIMLQATSSFFPGAWVVRDSGQSWIFALFAAAVRGFRATLFFLLSGYLTMLLYRKRGLKALLS